MPTKASRKTIETAIFMFFIVLAGFLQYYDISLPPFYAQTFSYLANTIFLILIFIWGKSIRQRIIQKGIRRKLVIIAVLLFFWLFIRFIKYNVFSRKDTISRYLWYMYYIPQCLVPPISLIAMMELTRKKKRKLVQTDLSHLDSGLCSYPSYPDKRFSSAGLCFQSDRGKFRCGIYTSNHLLSSDCMDHHHDFPFTCHFDSKVQYFRLQKKNLDSAPCLSNHYNSLHTMFHLCYTVL